MIRCGNDGSNDYPLGRVAADDFKVPWIAIQDAVDIRLVLPDLRRKLPSGEFRFKQELCINLNKEFVRHEQVSSIDGNRIRKHGAIRNETERSSFLTVALW